MALHYYLYKPRRIHPYGEVGLAPHISTWALVKLSNWPIAFPCLSVSLLLRVRSWSSLPHNAQLGETQLWNLKTPLFFSLLLVKFVGYRLIWLFNLWWGTGKIWRLLNKNRSKRKLRSFIVTWFVFKFTCIFSIILKVFTFIFRHDDRCIC